MAVGFDFKSAFFVLKIPPGTLCFTIPGGNYYHKLILSVEKIILVCQPDFQ